MSHPPVFPAFLEALAENPEAIQELSPMTFWRYANGILPKGIDWLMRHPNLLRALAEDAERQQAQEPELAGVH